MNGPRHQAYQVRADQPEAQNKADLYGIQPSEDEEGRPIPRIQDSALRNDRGQRGTSRDIQRCTASNQSSLIDRGRTGSKERGHSLVEASRSAGLKEEYNGRSCSKGRGAESQTLSVEDRGLGMGGGSPYIDEAADAYSLLVEKVVKAAEMEATLKRLLEEIEATKRRVNALEFKVIPEMKEAQTFIQLRLEEMEREETFRLKRFKNK